MPEHRPDEAYTRIDVGREVNMAGQRAPHPATNERIVQLLEEVKAQLAESRKREQKIARDLERLISRK